ncbi:MAG: ABC transporter substrate-binding protein, partial [Pseudomonadota bacterium]
TPSRRTRLVVRSTDVLGLFEDVTVGFLGFAETYLGAFGEGKGQNMWVTVPFVASSEAEGTQDFVSKIRAAAGEDVPISHYVMTHYNSLIAVKAALEASGEIDSEALIDGLEGLEITTPTGPATIGATDHHVTMNMYLAKTEGLGLDVIEELGSLAPEALCN